MLRSGTNAGIYSVDVFRRNGDKVENGLPYVERIADLLGNNQQEVEKYSIYKEISKISSCVLRTVI